MYIHPIAVDHALKILGCDLQLDPQHSKLAS